MSNIGLWNRDDNSRNPDLQNCRKAVWEMARDNRTIPAA